MKRFLMILMVTFTCLSLFSSVAEAKRFGGGSSFGKQRAIPQQRQVQKEAQKAPEQTPAKPAASGASKWLGPLAGLAIGAGLASLFAGSGFGGAMGTLLMALLAAGVIMFLIARMRPQPEPALQYASSGAPLGMPEPAAESAYNTGSSTPVMATPAASIPPDFPVEEFLRNGKRTFIRLQAANDRKDLNDIREYTTPEVFAEISMQFQERGDAVQKTDVQSVEAELLEVATNGDHSIASVRFTAQLRENDGLPESVEEIWHVQKNLHDEKSVWLLAGIQQTPVM